MKAKFENREAWLHAAALRLLPLFEGHCETSQAYRIGVGFPSAGLRGKAIGECWAYVCTKDEVCEIFLSPLMNGEARILDVLAHEMIHAFVGHEAKHGPRFRKVALAIGLEGKMTATVAGESFTKFIQPILADLGPLPYSALATMAAAKKKQKSRMHKCECAACKYTVRVAQKWINTAVPTCPNEDCESHGEPMTVEQPEESGDE